MVTNLTILWEAFHDYFIHGARNSFLWSGEDVADRLFVILLLSTVTKGLDQPVLPSFYSPGKISLFVSFHI